MGYIVLGISGIISGLIAGFLSRNNGIQIGLIEAGTHIILILFLGIFFKSNVTFFSWSNLLKLLFMIFSPIIGAIIGVNLRKRY